MSRVPLFLRKFVLDFVETGLAAIFALSVVGDAAALGHAVLAAAIASAIAAARRELPDFLAWLAGALKVPQS